jgi:hypothetical protein
VATPNGGWCQVQPVFNPQRGSALLFAVYSDGLQDLRLRCYGPSYAAVLDQDLGRLAAGWLRVSVPAQGLPAGLYWARLSADHKPLGKPVRVLYLP